MRPEFDAPANVGAWMSTRDGGVSVAPWDTLNLGTAVGDDPAAVRENRERFARRLGAVPVYLRQVHGSRVVRIDREMADAEPQEADAAFTTEPGVACTVQVADCMPVLLAAPDGRAVAAAHGGWRGLAGGVVEAALAAVCDAAACAPHDIVAWLGPCIGPREFEVGADVVDAFGGDPRCFVPRPRADGSPRWLADLPQLGRERLRAQGVMRVSGGQWCTVSERSRFFSFRRDGVTGRMAAAVWIRG
jgi:YfiH family protein